MPECPPRSKSETVSTNKPKLPTPPAPNSHPKPSVGSSTSVRGSISSDPVCVPFWNSACNEESKRLWLPTATDSVASGSNSSSGYWENTIPGSWFSIRRLQTPLTPSQKTSWLLSQCFRLVHTVCENTNEHFKKSSKETKTSPHQPNELKEHSQQKKPIPKRTKEERKRLQEERKRLQEGRKEARITEAKLREQNEEKYKYEKKLKALHADESKLHAENI
jgi:hypothetical protein